MRFATLQDGLQKRFHEEPAESCWTNGRWAFEMRNAVLRSDGARADRKTGQSQRFGISIFISRFDHVAHHNSDRQSHLFELQEIDRLIGRIWTAIQKSSLADETASDGFRPRLQHRRKESTVRATIL